MLDLLSGLQCFGFLDNNFFTEQVVGLQSQSTTWRISLSLSHFPVAPTLEHMASVKHFVSLQFLNPKTDGRTLWTGDQPVARPLPTQDNTNTE
jgi:hypothetical protein